MTDAPERIWARTQPNGALGYWHDATSDETTAKIAANKMVGYIRADIHAAALERIAALEGALRGLIDRYDEVVTTPDCSCSQDDLDVQIARAALTSGGVK